MSKIVIVDITDSIRSLERCLIEVGVNPMYVNWEEAIAHYVDCWVLGSIYSSMVKGILEDNLYDYKLPTHITRGIIEEIEGDVYMLLNNSIGPHLAGMQQCSHTWISSRVVMLEILESRATPHPPVSNVSRSHYVQHKACDSPSPRYS